VIHRPAVKIDSDGLAPLGDLVDELRVLLGLELTAYVARAGHPAEFLAWLARVDPATGALAADRLAVTRRLADVFRRANAATRLRSWLREVDPELGGRCPAEIIRESGNVPALVGAARRSLRRGGLAYR